MHFNDQLRNQREKQNLSLKDAAERLHLSETAYRDREDNRIHMNIPERCGLLTGLGMDFDGAVKVARQFNSYTLGELAEEYEKHSDDPFVVETDKLFIFKNRESDGQEYEIQKQRIRSAEDIVGWVFHMTEKTWITNDHIHLFTALASRYLNLDIHGV